MKSRTQERMIDRLMKPFKYARRTGAQDLTTPWRAFHYPTPFTMKVGWIVQQPEGPARVERVTEACTYLAFLTKEEQSFMATHGAGALCYSEGWQDRISSRAEVTVLAK